MSGHGIEQVIFRVAEALRIPVLILALLALAAVLVDAGFVTAEVFRRRHRSLQKLDKAAREARLAANEGRRDDAVAALLPCTWSPAMAKVVRQLLAIRGRAMSDERASKILADFDYTSMRRLERSRVLVRAGPALGLMGTLIPLSPALAALAQGNVQELSENLRVAFSVTILGLLVGMVAYAIALIRDRLYSQDLSDLEYVAAILAEEGHEDDLASAQPGEGTAGSVGRPAGRPGEPVRPGDRAGRGVPVGGAGVAQAHRPAEPA
jgi:biopolymer transport protein ExbB/TolQ